MSLNNQKTKESRMLRSQQSYQALSGLNNYPKPESPNDYKNRMGKTMKGHMSMQDILLFSEQILESQDETNEIRIDQDGSLQIKQDIMENKEQEDPSIEVQIKQIEINISNVDKRLKSEPKLNSIQVQKSMIQGEQQIDFIKYQSNGWEFYHSIQDPSNEDTKGMVMDNLGLTSIPEIFYGQSQLYILNKEHNILLDFNAVDSLSYCNKQKRYQYLAPYTGLNMLFDDPDVNNHSQSQNSDNFQDKGLNYIDIIPQDIRHPVILNTDWSFTSPYKGTVCYLSKATNWLQQKGLTIQTNDTPKIGGLTIIDAPNEKIPFQMLTPKNQIIHNGEIQLFESNLEERGNSMSKVRFRVMKDCFFVLLRSYLRVDEAGVRIMDTRLFHKFGDNLIHREFCYKESTFQELEETGFLVSDEWLQHPNQSDMVSHKLIDQLMTQQRISFNDERPSILDQSSIQQLVPTITIQSRGGDIGPDSNDGDVTSSDGEERSIGNNDAGSEVNSVQGPQQQMLKTESNFAAMKEHIVGQMVDLKKFIQSKEMFELKPNIETSPLNTPVVARQESPSESDSDSSTGWNDGVVKVHTVLNSDQKKLATSVADVGGVDREPTSGADGQSQWYQSLIDKIQSDQQNMFEKFSINPNQLIPELEEEEVQIIVKNKKELSQIEEVKEEATVEKVGEDEYDDEEDDDEVIPESTLKATQIEVKNILSQIEQANQEEIEDEASLSPEPVNEIQKLPVQLQPLIQQQIKQIKEILPIKKIYPILAPVPEKQQNQVEIAEQSPKEELLKEMSLKQAKTQTSDNNSDVQNTVNQLISALMSDELRFNRFETMIRQQHSKNKNVGLGRSKTMDIKKINSRPLIERMNEVQLANGCSELKNPGFKKDTTKKFGALIEEEKFSQSSGDELKMDIELEVKPVIQTLNPQKTVIPMFGKNKRKSVVIKSASISKDKSDYESESLGSVSAQAMSEMEKPSNKSFKEKEKLIILPDSTLDHHQKSYQESVIRIMARKQQNITKVMEKLAKRMTNLPMKCYKYNNSIDPSTQDFCFYESTLQLSAEGKNFIIMCKKLKSKKVYIDEDNNYMSLHQLNEMDNKIHTSSHRSKSQRYFDAQMVYKRRQESSISKMVKQIQKPKKESHAESGDHKFTVCNSHDAKEISLSYESDDIISTDNEVNPSLKKHEWVKSKASFLISDVCGFIVGGISSRFWLLRKHKNLIKAEKYNNSKNVPFYAWECITIQLKDRDIDLVIKKQQNMENLITLLNYSINSIDGTRNSAQQYLKVKGKPGEQNLIKSEIMHKVAIRFKILRIRQKISFMAFRQKKTISELILNVILRTYDSLERHGLVQKHHNQFEKFKSIILSDKKEEMKMIMNAIIDGDINNTFSTIMKLNSKNLKFPGFKQILATISKRENDATTGQTEIDIQRRQQAVIERIMSVTNKNNCQDIFQDIKINGCYMYQPKIEGTRVQLKYKYKKYMQQYKKIELIIQLKAVNGPNLLKCILKKYALAKELFIQEIENGNEVYIPKELSQDNLPYSMRYYDPLLQIIDSQISLERKEYFYNKIKEKFEGTKKSISQMLLNKLESDGKIIIKPIEQKQKGMESHVDHNLSDHTLQLQRSKYIRIDDDMKYFKPKDNTLQLKYCKPVDVARKKHQFLIFKAIFLQKIGHMSELGDKTQKLQKTNQQAVRIINDIFNEKWDTDYMGNSDKFGQSGHSYFKEKCIQNITAYYQKKQLNKYYVTRRTQITQLNGLLNCTCTPFEKKNYQIEKKISQKLGLIDLFLTYQTEEGGCGKNHRQSLNQLKAKIIKNEQKFGRVKHKH